LAGRGRGHAPRVAFSKDFGIIENGMEARRDR
jgi:hypothetical protein